MIKMARLEVFLGEQDYYGHRPLAEVLLEMAARSGITGATLWRGMEGYGRSGVLHSARLLDSSEDLPLVVELVDTPAHIQAFMVQARGLLARCLVAVGEVARVSFGREL